jgi:hypothetical protein
MQGAIECLPIYEMRQYPFKIHDKQGITNESCGYLYRQCAVGTGPCLAFPGMILSKELKIIGEYTDTVGLPLAVYAGIIFRAFNTNNKRGIMPNSISRECSRKIVLYQRILTPKPGKDR